MAKVTPITAAKRAVETFMAARPKPLMDLGLVDDFAPDQGGLGDWAHKTFIQPGGPLHNPRHEHLIGAHIGWLWTSAEASDRNRGVAGQCQLVTPPQSKWPSARQHWLWRHWFGSAPDFVITISAPIAADMDDWSFCALIEHELCHAAQDVDAFGGPRFTREGMPIYRVVSHDYEEFLDVIERYGVGATGMTAVADAIKRGPTIGEAAISAACGTCARKFG